MCYSLSVSLHKYKLCRCDSNDCKWQTDESVSVRDDVTESKVWAQEPELLRFSLLVTALVKSNSVPIYTIAVYFILDMGGNQTLITLLWMERSTHSFSDLKIITTQANRLAN